jgi:AAA+ ATPase superfamily predicted ATPase
MKFYNRGAEVTKLSEIQNYSLKQGQFTVLMGISRVGKTALYNEFMKQQNTNGAAEFF